MQVTFVKQRDPLKSVQGALKHIQTQSEHLFQPHFHLQMSLSMCLSQCAITDCIQAAASFPGTGEKVGCLRGRGAQRELESGTRTKTFTLFSATWHHPIEDIFAPHFSPWQIAQKTH